MTEKIAPKRRPQVKLGYMANHVLIGLLQAEYVASGLSDAEFANKVRDKVHPELNAAHVSHRRVACGIENNIRPGKPPASDIDALLAMITSLEARVAALENPTKPMF